MYRLLVWLLTTAASLAAAAWLVDGIRFTATDVAESPGDRLVTLLLVSLVLGVVTAVVKPVFKLLSLPLILLTLGLFLLVINAAMLLLTSWLAQQLGLGFTVTGFWAAVGGSIVITVVTWALDLVLDRERAR